MIDWSDPVARLRLIESVGIDEYNKRIEEHLRASVVVTAGGREIREIKTPQYGKLYNVSGLNVAFRTVREAVAEAEASPLKPATREACAACRNGRTHDHG